MKRRLALGSLAACVALVAGCGGDGAGGGSGSLRDTLGYLPDDAPLVFVLSTDLDSDQYGALDDKLDALGVPGGVDDLLDESLDEETEPGVEPLSYEDDVRPLLGEDLVVGATSPPAASPASGLLTAVDFAAIEVGDPDKLATLLESPSFELRRDGEVEGAALYRPEDGGEADVTVALDDATLLVANSPAVLRDALERHDGGEGLDVEGFSGAVEGLPEEAPLRIAASPEAVFFSPELDAAREVPWVGAIRSFGAAVSVSEDGLVLDATVKTDSGDLSEDDLPVAAGEEQLELLERNGELVSASVDQSVSTRFLLEAVATVYPDSEFERRRAEVERDLGVELDDLLALFDGPSVSAQAPDGIVTTRSEVSDPEMLAAALPKLVPRLPALAEALGPIGERTVLTAVRTVAPKLPIPGEGLDEPGVTAGPLPGEEGLYRLSAAEPEVSGRNEQVVFGVVERFFVVTEDADAAREIADAPARAVDGLSGGAVFSADPQFLSGLLESLAGASGVPGVEGARGWVRASTEQLRGHAELRIR